MKKTLLYVASAPRSGSTLLTNLLGNCPEFFNVGEIHNLSDFLNEGRQGRYFNGNCACGEKIRHCGKWNGIIEKAVSELSLDSDKKLTTRVSSDFLRSKWNRLSRASMSRELQQRAQSDKKMSLVARHNFTLMEAAMKITGAKMIVDSSKIPSTLACYLFNKPDDWDVKVIHLARDPRGTALSIVRGLIKAGVQPKSYYHHLVGILLRMRLTECLTDLLDDSNVLNLRLEEICGNPKQSMNRIVKFVSEGDGCMSWSGEGAQRHDIGGSVNISGPVGLKNIKLDEAWKGQMTLCMNLYHRFAQAVLRTQFRY